MIGLEYSRRDSPLRLEETKDLQKAEKWNQYVLVDSKKRHEKRMLRVFAKHKKEITYEKWIVFIGSSRKKEEFGEVGERKAAFYRARKPAT